MLARLFLDCGGHELLHWHSSCERGQVKQELGHHVSRLALSSAACIAQNGGNLPLFGHSAPAATSSAIVEAVGRSR
jgi:hypothetical protein